VGDYSKETNLPHAFSLHVNNTAWLLLLLVENIHSYGRLLI
jgi:hypothetical protein